MTGTKIRPKLIPSRPASQSDWTPYDAVAACEGFDGIEHDEIDLISAWQFLIDSGLAWSLQGSFGRQAKYMIDAGVCHD